jgi:4-amino-4-deoxy-L-arabinose transferase-like glycosyltransferase
VTPQRASISGPAAAAGERVNQHDQDPPPHHGPHTSADTLARTPRQGNVAAAARGLDRFLAGRGSAKMRGMVDEVSASGAAASATPAAPRGLARLDEPVRWALLVALVSLAVRLPWACLAQVAPISDFAGYDSLAWTWLDTGQFESDAYRTPGYPAFLAAVYALFGHSWRAAQIAQSFVGALTSGLLVLLAARVVAPRTAAIAGLVHALWITSIAYVAVLASENLATPVVLAMLFALTAERDTARRRAAMTAVAGALMALAVLIRPANLYLLPAAAVLAVWEPRSARRRILPAIAFAAAALIAISPWLIRNHERGLGITTVSTAGGVNLWMGNKNGATTGGFSGGYAAAKRAGFPAAEPERYRALQSAAFRWIAGHPGRYLQLCAVRGLRMFGTTPDPFAARFLWPTGENDAILRAAGGRAAPAPARDAALALRRQCEEILRALRVVLAPLLFLALLLCLRRARAYAVVLLPVAFYGGLLAATFFQERFREGSELLLFIPLAALLSDLATGGDELGWPGRRRHIAAAAALAVLASAGVHALGWDAGLYSL